MSGAQKRRVHNWRRGRDEEIRSQSITPRMLVNALRHLRKYRLFGVYFNPIQVTRMIEHVYPFVEQNREELMTEVKDKLKCAAEAKIIGLKEDAGYYPLNMKEEGLRLDTRSERTFWLMYKRIKAERKRKKSSSVKEEKPERPSIV